MLVCGLGRSGSNWLLDILDLDPHTHCRNEPNEIPDSPFAALGSRWALNGPGFADDWDRASAWVCRRIGRRDHPATLRKAHIHPVSRVLGLGRLVYGARARRLAAHLLPALRAAECPLPRWLGSRAALGGAVPVIKVLSAPAWAARVLAERWNWRVVHMVRHPGGYLDSWRRRYLTAADPRAVIEASRRRLREVAAAEPVWARRCGEIDAMSIEALELCFWRYATETIHRAGEGTGRYELVIYEDLVRDPVGRSRRLYAACGLTWSARAEASVRRSARHSASIADAWRRRVPAAEARLIEATLAETPMARWW